MRGINPLNAELIPICRLLALLGAHPILRISRIRVNMDWIHLAQFNFLFVFLFALFSRVNLTTVSSLRHKGKVKRSYSHTSLVRCVIKHREKFYLSLCNGQRQNLTFSDPEKRRVATSYVLSYVKRVKVRNSTDSNSTSIRLC
jgi:hypothetical protein